MWIYEIVCPVMGLLSKKTTLRGTETKPIISIVHYTSYNVYFLCHACLLRVNRFMLYRLWYNNKLHLDQRTLLAKGSCVLIIKLVQTEDVGLWKPNHSPIHQSINQSIVQSFYQSINQSINPSINQPINQPNIQYFDQSIDSV